MRMEGALLIVLLAGCQPERAVPTFTPSAIAASSPAAPAPADMIEARVASLEKKVVALQTDKTIRDIEKVNVAWFDPQEPKKYTPLKSPAGPVLIVLENIEPYLDGFKVTFRLGNPTSAAFNGVKGKISWGRTFDPQKPAEDLQTQTKDFDDPGIFPAGAWTYLRVNIGPATAAQARSIGIAPQFDQVSLRGPSQ